MPQCATAGVLLRQVPPAEPLYLIRAEQADVGRDATRADGQATTHQATCALFSQNLANSRSETRGFAAFNSWRSLHSRLDSVDRVHGHVFHHPGAASCHCMLPEGRRLVPLLPFQGRLMWNLAFYVSSFYVSSSAMGIGSNGYLVAAETVERHRYGLVSAPADSRCWHGQRNAWTKTPEEAPRALLLQYHGHCRRDAIIPQLHGSPVIAASHCCLLNRCEAALGLQFRLDDVEGQRAVEAMAPLQPAAKKYQGAAENRCWACTAPRSRNRFSDSLVATKMPM
eukprot:CAMPEP_0172772606 /NCGR_PEP_ID=MMETSP1074-20121228/192683_1 /TAXON_ID=2916 /ORGANISM="Ceratium fusus, Strain PA161109" /LENGTH=281 /DNA_ID=CAMNT_0013608755 /DNA_START=594 /DNA_END=1441 /DNA_ORIENTATION=+